MTCVRVRCKKLALLDWPGGAAALCVDLSLLIGNPILNNH
jgi:hypothetical protein